MDTGPDILLYVEYIAIGISILLCLVVGSKQFFGGDGIKAQSKDIAYLFVSLLLLVLKICIISISLKSPILQILMFILHWTVLLGIFVLNSVILEIFNKFDKTISIEKIRASRLVLYIFYVLGMLPAIVDVYFIVASLSRTWIHNYLFYSRLIWELGINILETIQYVAVYYRSTKTSAMEYTVLQKELPGRIWIFILAFVLSWCSFILLVFSNQQLSDCAMAFNCLRVSLLVVIKKLIQRISRKLLKPKKMSGIYSHQSYLPKSASSGYEPSRSFNDGTQSYKSYQESSKSYKEPGCLSREDQVRRSNTKEENRSNKSVLAKLEELIQEEERKANINQGETRRHSNIKQRDQSFPRLEEIKRAHTYTDRRKSLKEDAVGKQFSPEEYRMTPSKSSKMLTEIDARRKSAQYSKPDFQL
ncbi:hypothetical protein HDV01_004456 [Terramyces sp. JEL0728]|nr:hypothetical protein HDV01_004456 [Terramyces sp. JEL0728]